MSHTCHAIDCTHHVPPEMFMCKPHWFSLPQRLRNRIWMTYRPGQCDDWQISAEYAKVAKESITYVAEREGKVVDPECAELSLYDILSPVEDRP